MNWEVIISAAVPVVSGVALMLYKMGAIDSKLAFLQRTVDGLIVRMDRIENRMGRIDNRMDRFERHFYKHHKKHK